MPRPGSIGPKMPSMPRSGGSNGQLRHYHIKKNPKMENTIRSSCLPVVDRARLTPRLIGLAFVLGCMTTRVGWSQPLPQMIFAQLVLKETPDFLISSPSHLFVITTSPSLRLPSPTDLSFKESQPPSQNVIVVSSITELGSTSCVRSITSMKPTMAYSLPSVLKTPASSACSRLLPPHQSQGKRL